MEQTFSWASRSRQVDKDDERLLGTSGALIYAAMTHLMARRIAHS